MSRKLSRGRGTQGEGAFSGRWRHREAAADSQCPGCGHHADAPPESSCAGSATCRKRLGEVGPGTAGTIASLDCRRQLKRRLMDMGVVSGTKFCVERVAPLGDPMELKLNGFNLSLRKAEACDIWVEVPCD